MAKKQIQQFPQVASVSDTDKVVAAVGTAFKNYYIEASQMKDYSVNPISITYAALLALQAGSTLVAGYRYFISLPTVTYNVATPYNLNDEVNDGAGNYYKSVQAANTGNALSDTAWWKQVYRGITLVANDVDALDMHAEINISSVTNFILFDFANDNVLAYSDDVINKYKLLDSNTTQVGTTAVTTEETLATYTMPANTLDVDGDIIEIRASGGGGGAGDIRLYFGSLAVELLSQNLISKTWSINALIYRTGSATQKTVSAYILQPDTMVGVGASTSANEVASLTEALTGDIIISVSGQNSIAQANDITIETFTVEHKKQ